MSVIRVIVAGGRDFNDWDQLRDVLDRLYRKLPKDKTMEVVSGAAPGADYMGEDWALRMLVPVKLFPADWNKYGRSAGPRRNRKMAEYSMYLIAFWDGVSKGTKSMIDIATELGLKVKVVKYAKKEEQA